MSISTTNNGPFVGKRHRHPGHQGHWQTPGHGEHRAKSKAGGMPAGLRIMFILAVPLVTFGLLAVGATSYYESAQLRAAEVQAASEAAALAEQAARVEADGGMTPGMAASIVGGAPKPLFDRCYREIEAAGWPTGATLGEARLARRIAVANCIVGG
jgi:hypothetical protein